MTDTAPTALQKSDPASRIIVALDVDTAARARELTAQLAGEIGAFKVGLQLFTAAGPAFVRELTEAGSRVFLDLKFHDIPNTVAMAAVEAARLGVWMLNVHALGGGEMMRRTANEVAETCIKENLKRPFVIGVTVLTSSDRETLLEVGIEREVGREVAELARLTAECGLDGVVASPHEIGAVRESVGERDFLIVTPGIRPVSATIDDQKRVTTPKAALAAGSDYLVIGRPVTAAADPIAAVRRILKDIDSY